MIVKISALEIKRARRERMDSTPALPRYENNWQVFRRLLQERGYIQPPLFMNYDPKTQSYVAEV